MISDSKKLGETRMLSSRMRTTLSDLHLSDLLPYVGVPLTDNPWTETPMDINPLVRDPLDRDPTPYHVTCDACWDREFPVNKMTHRCKNITFPQTCLRAVKISRIKRIQSCNLSCDK